MLKQDTILKGDTSFYIATHQITDSLYYVSVSNNASCPYVPNYHILHKEDCAPIHVTLRQPLDASVLTVTYDSICYNGTANLTASSDIDFPQYYIWWNNDMTTVLQRDTVQEDNISHFSPSNQISDSIYSVTVSNDHSCPFELGIHCKNKIATENFLFNSEKNGNATMVSVNDSIPFYDEGGPNGDYFNNNVRFAHTFTAESGNIVLQLTDFNTESTSYDYLMVYDGPTDYGTTLGGDAQGRIGGDLTGHFFCGLTLKK